MKPNTQSIHIGQYSYDLPQNRIAKYPLPNRDESKLLIYTNNKISHTQFKQIPGYLPENSLLVFNNTKVIRARMLFFKPSGAAIEIFCLEPVEPVTYESNFAQTSRVVWKCLVGNSKKWKTGKLSRTILRENKEVEISIERKGNQQSPQNIEFQWKDSSVTFARILNSFGTTPIPPYLNRDAEPIDKTRYQTVYSKKNGSVAAPTSGLHFTDHVLDEIKTLGIKTEELTLHIGAGTFQPVKSETIGGHDMHTERVSVNVETLKQLHHFADSIIAVGTTSVRTLESLYHLANKLYNKNNDTKNLFVNQWQPYNNENNISSARAIEILIEYAEKNNMEKIDFNTQIIIIPGYCFKLTKGMITNFHQPRSTLLLLIAAYVGNRWKEIYNYAMKNDFRFLSYGDSSLLLQGDSFSDDCLVLK